MVFFINLLYSTLITYGIGKIYSKYKLSNGVLFVLLFSIGFVWITLCGGQYYVGTDYPTYLNLFNGIDLSYYFNPKKEYIFYYLVVFFNSIGIRGQCLFYIFYLINFIFLFLILKRLKLKYIFIFILLYITYSNIFNNQLNTLRQATAIHICTYSGILYSENKIKQCISGIIVATFIHLSSLCMLSILIFKKLKFYKDINKQLKILLIISIVGMFCISYNSFSFITQLLPIEYQIYFNNTSELNSLNIITKLIFVPLFWMSCNINKNNFTKSQVLLYNIGFIGFCLKLFLLKLPIVNRLSDFYIILTIFPLYYLLVYLYENRKTLLFNTICLFLIAFYGIKTIIYPNSEYLYNSIYFNL